MIRFDKRLLFLLFLAIEVMPAMAQRDTTFWFAAPDITAYETPQYLRLTALSKEATVTITQPANAGFAAITRTVAPNTTVSIDFTSLLSQVENSGADVVTNKGMLIQSTQKILSTWEPSQQYNPDIFALKGNNALGTDFIVVSQKTYPSPTIPSSFYVVATENSTTISITPSVDLVGHPKASGTYTVTLNRGQVYVADASATTIDNVGGTIVTSDKPVAITMANDLTSVPPVCGDLNGDQLVPTSRGGDKFITLPGGLTLNGVTDIVYVYPVANNTQILVNGVVAATKNRGEYYELKNQNGVNYITTSGPAMVYQLSGFGCEVGGAVVPGLDCTGSTTVGVTRSTNEDFSLILLIKSGNEGNFTFNGSNSVITSSIFNNVPASNGEWKWAKFPGPLLAGETGVITNKYPFHLGVINGSGVGGTRYGYFSNFGDFQPDIFQTPNTFGDLYTTINGIAYQWIRGGVDISGANNQTFTASESGKYQVKVTYDANCLPGTSEAIKLALTPANVGNLPALWLRADQGVTSSAGSVSNWLDTSGSDNHHSQSTSSNQPGYDDKIANFNPAVTFNGSQWVQDNNGILEAGVNYKTTQLFLVHNSESVSNRGLYGQYVNIDGSVTARYMGHGEFNGTQYFGIKSDNGLNSWVELPNGPERLNAYVINTFAVNAAKNQQLWFNGGNLFESSFGGTTFTAPNPAKPWVTGAAPAASGSFLSPTAFKQKGQISELIVFEEELPEYKRHRVETYLAIKYGSQVVHNYYNTSYDGTNAATTTVYNVSTYGNNIAGIARDDQGAFYQKQGRSQNSVPYSRMLTMGVGEIAASNALNTNTLDNGTYLVWGDDGAAPTERNDNDANPAAKILGRAWKIQVTGTSPGNITVNFDLTGITTTGTAITDFKLAVNRSGIPYFTPGAVDYYDADVSSTATSLTFKNVKWDTDGNGLDVFTLQTASVPCTIPYIPAITQSVVDPCNGPVNLSVSGAAIDLDGTDDYVEIPNVLVGAANFTFEAWVFYRGGGSWARIIDFGNDTNEYMILSVKSDAFSAVPGVPMVAFSRTSSAGEQRIYSQVPFPLNQWAHIAFTIEGTTGKLYINGQVTGQKNNLTLTLANLPATSKNYIGKSQYAQDPLLNAKVDEVRFWTVARTQQQLLDGMRNRYPNNYSNLVGYYSFDEGNGTKAYDGSVNAGIGTLVNGTKWESPSTSPSGSFQSVLWSNGSTSVSVPVTSSGNYSVAVVDSRGCTGSLETSVLVGAIAPQVIVDQSAYCPVNLLTGGYGLVLDGTNDYLEISNPLSTAQNFTFETWALWQGGSAGQRLFDFGSGSGPNMYLTVSADDGKPRFVINLDAGGNVAGEQRISSSAAMTVNQWTHVAVTIDNGVGRLYLNGVQVGVNTSITSFPSGLGATTQNWLGRAQGSSSYFKGKLDEVRFWSVGRTAAQIDQYKTIRFPANYSGLIAYYQFDEGTGTSINDKSTAAYVGALKNGPQWEIASSPSGSYAAYKWSTNETTPNIVVKTAGNYSVETTDGNGCKATSVAVPLSTPKFPTPTLTADGPTTFCYNIGVNLTSSTATNIKWYRDGSVLPGVTSQTVHRVDSGIFKVVVEKDGCFSDPSANIALHIDLGCDQDGDGVTDGDELLDNTGYLEFCDYLISSQTVTPTVDWKTADCDKDGNPNGTDPNVNAPTAVNDDIGLLEAAYTKFNVLTNDDFLAGPNVTIERIGGTAKGAEVIDQATGEITYRSAPGEVGTVTLIYKACNTAVTPQVCAEATITLEIDIAELSIPEGFSPNGNGKNDKWVITGLEAYPNNSVKVFNRWGNEVYSAAPYKYSWDGSSVSGGRVPAATYYYVLDLGNGKRLTGYVYVAY